MKTTASRSIPPGWALVTVREAGEAELGQQKRTNIDSHSHVRYLRVANVQDDVIDFSDVASMGVVDRDRYKLEAGDILICEGQSRELVGRAAMYRGELKPLFYQNSLIRFRPGNNVLPEYALAVFRYYQKSGKFSQIAKATTSIAHLGLGRFRALPFLIPPLEVQDEIATKYRERQEELDRLASSVSASGVTLSSIQPRAIDQLIGVQGVVSTDSSAETIETSWPTLTAAEVVDSEAPITYGILKPGPEEESGVPYIRGQDLQQGEVLVGQLRRTSHSIDETHQRSRLLPGDVLLGIIRHTRVATVPDELEGANITQGTARLRPGAKIASNFLAYWLSSQSAQSWLHSRMRGIDMPGLNLRDVRLLPVPVPPLDVQAKVVERLDSVAMHVDLAKQACETVLLNLAQLEVRLLRELTHADAALPMDQDGEALREDRGHGRGAAKDNKSSELEVTTNSPASLKSNGPVSTSPEEVLRALGELGGNATPEDILTTLNVSAEAVDSFFLALRQLTLQKAIVSVRPDSSLVRIELRA